MLHKSHNFSTNISRKKQYLERISQTHLFILFLLKSSSQFDLFHHFTEEDVKHYFLPIDNVIYAYVVESEEKKITDFVSFYCLPSTIINHPKHSQLRAAYSYYHVSTVTPLNTLINNALILAK